MAPVTCSVSLVQLGADSTCIIAVISVFVNTNLRVESWTKKVVFYSTMVLTVKPTDIRTKLFMIVE